MKQLSRTRGKAYGEYYYIYSENRLKEHCFERKYFCACILSSKTKNGPGKTRTESHAQEKLSEQLFTHTSLSDVYE